MRDSVVADVWITVPTYWTYPAGEKGPAGLVFDHPTPLDTEGTLGRLLESFRVLEGDFAVLVIAACTHPSLGDRTAARVAGIVRPFRHDFPLYLVSPRCMDEINALLPDPLLSLAGYGNIRNVQLLLPYAAGAEAVAGIDDDEVIRDPAYLEKGMALIGRDLRNGRAAGLAGPYLDREGEYRIPGAEDLASCGNVFLKKNFFMNDALVRVMSDAATDGAVESNVAFGGNMWFHRSTIARACHDPWIARGEDFDYVINAAMEGMRFYFRPDMPVVHLPPDADGSQAGDSLAKLLADIRRFVYMREKMRRMERHRPENAFDVSYLMPYPGVYLDPSLDLEAEAVSALDGKYPEFRRERGSPEDFVCRAVVSGRENAVKFFAYRDRWQAVFGEMDTGRVADRLGSYRVE